MLEEWNNCDLTEWQEQQQPSHTFFQQLKQDSMVQLEKSPSQDKDPQAPSEWVLIIAPESMKGWISDQLVYGPYYPPVVFVAAPSAPNLGEFVLQERSADVAEWLPRWVHPASQGCLADEASAA